MVAFFAQYAAYGSNHNQCYGIFMECVMMLLIS